MLTASNHCEMHSSPASTSGSDSDEQLYSKQGINPQNKKLKNELCRNYLNMGFCKYSQRCQFAHGIEELRQSQSTNVKYKTKICQSYFTKGCCIYGQRCNFLHSKPSEMNILINEQKWRKIKLGFRDIIEESLSQSRFFSLKQTTLN